MAADEGGEGVGGEDDCDEDTTPRKAKTSLADCGDDDDDDDDDDDSESPPGLSTVTTPDGSRMKLRTSSHPIGVLTKSAPSSMRREQTSASRAMLGASGESSRASGSGGGDGDVDVGRTMTGRSWSSTGGIFETDVHAVEDFDRLPDTLKFNTAMRREVQLGRAKALHTDFGQHDFHPDESHDDEEETEVEEGGGGEAAVTGGDGPVDVVSPERRRCIVM